MNSRERKVRMTGQERRAQLLDVGRTVFAERGYEAASVEEIAARAKISKPIVDREVQTLLGRITESLEGDHPRALLQQAAMAFLTYIEDEPEGFRILVRDSPVTSSTGTLASVIGDIATQVEYILRDEFELRGFNTKLSPLYSQALVGMVALVGQWWLDSGEPKKEVVAAHLVNLAWNGLSALEQKPSIERRKP
jgi:AcrR family transcriptional regulator